MSDMINKIYDEMELDEVLCRLPSEFAINSVKRRVTNIEQLIKFFGSRDAGRANKFKEIKDHINRLIYNTKVKDVLESIEIKHHPVLFSWIDDCNKNRILKEGKDNLTIELVFNLTDSDDLDGMQYVLDRILLDKNPKTSKITSVLNKASTNNFQDLINRVIKDTRPKVRSSVMSVHNKSNFDTVSDHQKMIALKAFAKIPSSESGSQHIQPIDFKLFKSLKPLERIMALDRYLNYFTPYRKQKVFNPEPTEDELNCILFAGCFEYNDIVEGIVKKYNSITKEDKPKK